MKEYLPYIGYISALALIVIFIIYRILKKSSRVTGLISGNTVKTFKQPLRKDYIFLNGLTAYQEELNFEQDEQLVLLIEDVDFSAMADNNKKISAFIDLLIRKKKLREAIRIILNIPDATDEQISTLYNSEIEVIFTDFFSLNPTAKNVQRILHLSAVITKFNPKTPEA